MGDYTVRVENSLNTDTATFHIAITGIKFTFYQFTSGIFRSSLIKGYRVQEHVNVGFYYEGEGGLSDKKMQ